MANLSSARTDISLRAISPKTPPADNDPLDRDPIDAGISRRRDPRVNQVLKLIGNEGFLRIRSGYSAEETEQVLKVLASKLGDLQQFVAYGRARAGNQPCTATNFALEYGIPGILASLASVRVIKESLGDIINCVDALRHRSGDDAHIVLRWTLDAYRKAFQLEGHSLFTLGDVEDLERISATSTSRVISPTILALAAVIQARKEQASLNGTEFCVRGGTYLRLANLVVIPRFEDASFISDEKLDIIVKHGLPALLKDRAGSVDVENCLDDLIAAAITPGIESTDLLFAIHHRPNILLGIRSKKDAERLKLVGDLYRQS